MRRKQIISARVTNKQNYIPAMSVQLLLNKRLSPIFIAPKSLSAKLHNSIDVFIFINKMQDCYKNSYCELNNVIDLSEK